MRYLSFSFLVFLFCSCDFSISDKPQKQIEWYKFHTSTFQLKDILDSIVSANSNLYYDSTDYFKKLNLNVIYGRDTINYLLHFSGDNLDWVTKPDSAYLALDAFGRLQPKNTWDESKELTSKEKDEYHRKFKSTVIDLLDSLCKKSNPYAIKPINDQTAKPRWVICKSSKSFCDTLIMIIEKGDYILSDTTN
jgi:hypothetical protein